MIDDWVYLPQLVLYNGLKGVVKMVIYCCSNK